MNQLPHAPPQKVIRAAESQSWIDGYAFLDEARKTADSLLNNARQDYEQRCAEGFEAGRTAGEIEIAKLLADTTARVDSYLAGLEREIAELALLIVERIIGQFDELELATALARQALGQFRHERELTINAAPNVAEAIDDLIANEFSELASVPITVVSDPNLADGRCVLMTPAAVVDTALDAQLSTVRAALLAARDTVVAAGWEA